MVTQNQIFLSHDSNDEDLISLVSEIVASTPYEWYRAGFEGLSEDVKEEQKPASEILKQEIKQSNALLFLLGGDVESHTMSWLAWEVGVATGQRNTPVLVVENSNNPYDESVTIPHVDDYIRFGGQSDEQLSEVRDQLQEVIDFHKGKDIDEKRKIVHCATGPLTETSGCHQKFGVWLDAKFGDEKFQCPACRRVELEWP